MYNPQRYLPYFNTVITNIGFVGQVPVQICKPNPTRVLMLWSCNQQQDILVNPPSNKLQFPPAFWLLKFTTLRLSWEDHGPLVTLEWWANNGNQPGGLAFTVTEITWQPPEDSEWM